MSEYADFKRRFDSLVRKIKILTTLKQTVCLPPAYDITSRQWEVLESQLSAIASRLLLKLKNQGRIHLQRFNELASRKALNNLLGEMELQLTQYLKVYDTYVDILTQRCSPRLGTLLSACDVIAWDAINKKHPALAIVEPPIVFCDRGFGASILREGVQIYGNERNPLPTIQIPYSKLVEQYNLSSIVHETGHEAYVRLGLVSVIPKAVRQALEMVSASNIIKDFYSMWMSEIVPDFWTFCNCGMAHAATTTEILSLPSQLVFQVSPLDPHPTPYIRVLLSYEWCRYLWGRSGPWEKWERKWLDIYSMEDIPKESGKIVKEAAKYIPVITNVLFNTKFRNLQGRTLTSLFDLDVLKPWKLQSIINLAETGVLKLTGLSPCAQLAVFRLLQDADGYTEPTVYKLMTSWLKSLGRQKLTLTADSKFR